MYVQVGDFCISTVPLTQISCNTFFSKFQNVRKAGTLSIVKATVSGVLEDIKFKMFTFQLNNTLLASSSIIISFSKVSHRMDPPVGSCSAAPLSTYSLVGPYQAGPHLHFAICQTPLSDVVHHRNGYECCSCPSMCLAAKLCNREAMVSKLKQILKQIFNVDILIELAIEKL